MRILTLSFLIFLINIQAKGPTMQDGKPFVIQHPFLYKAEKPHKPNIYLFGTMHLDVGLENFSPNIWKLLGQSNTLFAESSGMSEAAGIRPKFIAEINDFLYQPILQLFPELNLLDYEIISLLKRKFKPLKVKSLDTSQIREEALDAEKPLEKLKNEYTEQDSIACPDMIAYAYYNGNSQSLHQTLVTDRCSVEDYGMSYAPPSPSYASALENADQVLLYKRNSMWMDKILEESENTQTPIAVVVGVAHMIEEDPKSLFHHLEKEGYSVHRISMEEVDQEVRDLESHQDSNSAS